MFGYFIFIVYIINLIYWYKIYDTLLKKNIKHSISFSVNIFMHTANSVYMQ